SSTTWTSCCASRSASAPSSSTCPPSPTGATPPAWPAPGRRSAPRRSASASSWRASSRRRSGCSGARPSGAASPAPPRARPPGVVVRRVPVVRAGRLARLLSFAAVAPRLVARERWDVVVGFGRTPRQGVVRVGGGTHRSYLARMEAAKLRRRWRGPYHRAILRLEAQALAPGAYRRVLAVSGRVGDEVAADYGVPRERISVLYNGVDLARFHPAHPT